MHDFDLFSKSFVMKDKKRGLTKDGEKVGTETTEVGS
jgi:hypothetical protein